MTDKLAGDERTEALAALAANGWQLVEGRDAITKTFKFKSFIEAVAHSAPLVLVFDDLQHAHEDSLELLRYLLEYLTGGVLLICSARPELLVRYDKIGMRFSGKANHFRTWAHALGDEVALTRPQWGAEVVYQW